VSRLPRGPSALATVLAARRDGNEFALGDAVSVKDCQASPKLTLELIQAFQEGRRGAAELLIEVYAPYIAKCVRRYSYFYTRDLDDFFQEGRLAILDACARWDFDRGSTSASSYVFKYVSGYLRRYSMVAESCVRVPVHAYDKKRMDGATKRAEWIREFRKNLTLAPVCALFSDFGERNAPAGHGIARGEADDALEDLIYDEGAEGAEEILATAELSAAASSVTPSVTALLDDRARDVLARRLGDEPDTLLEIGEDYGLSRERIRQIEENALEACRAHAIKGMRCAPEKFDRFEYWVDALAGHVRGPGREQAEWEARARASTSSTEAA
jgi:RNA polymerase sigma-32 factor